jgi:hypothetical protein
MSMLDFRFFSKYPYGGLTDRVQARTGAARWRGFLALTVLTAGCGTTIRPTATPTAASVATVAPTTSLPVATTTVPPPTTTVPSTTTTVPSKPVTVPGGTLTITGRNVQLTTVVQTGESLFAIAGWFNLYGGYMALYAFNRATIGSNANLIFPGEVLHEEVPLKELPSISKKYLVESAVHG